MFFIGTRDPRINAARVANRVMEGGHTVPIEKILSRFERSVANLPVAIQIAHRAYIFDNSEDGVEACRARVAAAGGEVTLPRTSIGEWGFIGLFVDSEGTASASTG